MSRRPAFCDVCTGTEFEPYLQSSPCGRALERCRVCGLVMAATDTAGTALAGPAPRDGRADARRAAVVMKLLPSGRVLEVGCGEGLFLSSLDPARYEVVGVEDCAEVAVAAGRRLAEAGLRGGVRPVSLVEAALPA